MKAEDRGHFENHVKQCPAFYNQDGIFEVDSDVLKAVTCLYSFFSGRECGWNSTVVKMETFEEGLKSFVYVKNNIPVGYIAFKPRELEGGGIQMVLEEIFVIDSFRKKGLAKELLKHGIKELNIKTLGVSAPVTPEGRDFLKKNITGEILLFKEGSSHGTYEVLDINDLISLSKYSDEFDDDTFNYDQDSQNDSSTILTCDHDYLIRLKKHNRLEKIICHVCEEEF